MAQFEIVIVDQSDGTREGRDRRPDAGVDQTRSRQPGVQRGASEEVAPGRRVTDDSSTIAVRQVAGSLADIAGRAGLGGIKTTMDQMLSIFDQIAKASVQPQRGSPIDAARGDGQSQPGGGESAGDGATTRRQAPRPELPTPPARARRRPGGPPPVPPPVTARVAPSTAAGTAARGATAAGGAAAGTSAAAGGSALAGAAAAAGPVLAIVGAIAVAVIAVKKFADAVDAEARRLEDVSPQVAAARAQNQIRAELARISQGQRIGPELARLEQFRGRAQVAIQERLQEIKVTMVRLIDPFLPLLNRMLQTFEAGTEGMQGVSDVLFSMKAFLEGRFTDSERFWKSAKKNMQDMVDILKRRDEEDLRDPILDALEHELDAAGGPLFGPDVFASRRIPDRKRNPAAP